MLPHIRRSVAAWILLGTAAGSLLADEAQHPLCSTLIDEERIQLEDAVLAAEVARSSFVAHEKIYRLIRGLWDADAVERMVYLEAKYDHDSYKLALERANLALEKQKALIDQYELVCGGKSRREIEAARLRYRKAYCAEQAKSIEVAEVNLEFDEELLDSVRNLFASEVATKTEVILAELEVELEQTRLADAKRRTELCRHELARAAAQ